jgi:putative endonuclease
MHFVYCLYSPSSGRTYVGRTSNLIGRIEAHNHPSNKGFTKRYQPWEIFYFEEFSTIEESSKREKYFKSGIGREFMQNQLKSYIEQNSLGSYPPRRT